jgi:hypothetical protein
MIFDKELFFDLQRGMDCVPFTQSQGWHDYQTYLKKSKCLYFVDDDTAPKICAWGLIRSFPLVGKILQISGESYRTEITRTQIKTFYDEIAVYSEKHFIFVLVSSQALYSVDYEIAIRQAGFIRPLVPLTCPLSILVDLNNIKYLRIWERQLKKASKNNLRFEYISNPNIDHINHVVRMYSELSELKQMGYILDADALSVLLRNNDYKLFFVRSCNGEPIAARITYLRNDFSCDVIAANSNKSRDIPGTSYFMVNSILEWLKGNNVKIFDFGRIGPGKRSTNSVYEFKSYIGSPEVSYNGEWIYSNSKFLETVFYAFMNLRMARF